MPFPEGLGGSRVIFPKDGKGLLGSAPASLPRPLPQSLEWCGEKGCWARCPWPRLRRKNILEPWRCSPSQSSTSALWFEWAKGVPAREKGQDRARRSDCLCPGPPGQ